MKMLMIERSGRESRGRGGIPCWLACSTTCSPQRMRCGTKSWIDELTKSGHTSLLYYVLQQVQQFRRLGKDFAMQHTNTEYLGELEEELQAAVLQAIPVEKRLQGLSPEDRVQGLSPEELAAGLSKEQVARLRELLERREGDASKPDKG